MSEGLNQNKREKKYSQEIDCSLLKNNLSLSYEERIQRHEGALKLVQELQKARMSLKKSSVDLSRHCETNNRHQSNRITL